MRPIVVSTSDASGGAKYSNLVRLDTWAMAQIGIQCVVVGTVDYTVQVSLDDPNSPTNPVAVASMTWFSFPDAQFINGTANALGFYSMPISYLRLVQNSGTGSVTMTVNQSGNVPL